MTALQFEALDTDQYLLEVNPYPAFMLLLHSPTAGHPAIAARLLLQQATPTSGGADDLGQVTSILTSKLAEGGQHE